MARSRRGCGEIRWALTPASGAAEPDIIEVALFAALAGAYASAGRPPSRFSWEGQRYRLDLAGSEEQRLPAVREKQAAYQSIWPSSIAGRLQQALGGYPGA